MSTSSGPVGIALPPPPRCAFASDNAAGAHPEVIEAIRRANSGHALAYGDDEITRRAIADIRELFDADVEVYFTFGGTGANVMALGCLLDQGEAVICSQWSHIAVDETGAPERLLGAKLLTATSSDARITPDDVEHFAQAIGTIHHAQPGVVSITQSTELGTVYDPGEIRAICERAHELGLRVHLDGARIANAVAALGGGRATLRAMTIDAGVDAVTFGGTKNGLLGAEAVVLCAPARGRRAPYLHKQFAQLPSKMRFVAAQFSALLADDLWLESAAHANAMAALLYERTGDIAGVSIENPPIVNSLFPLLPAAAIAPLQHWCFFWDWDHSRGQVRWMTAWDTTAEDVETFAAGVGQILAVCN